MSPEEIRTLAQSLTQHLDGLKDWGVREIPLGPLGGSNAQALARLEQEVIACTRCALYRTRTHHVFGEGSPNAKLVFVGEAPGREEDLQGRPFVGAAGQLLTKMIRAMGLAREDVYICNVLKDRPPENRTPEPKEIAACLPFLEQQLAIIQPKVMCALGAVAAKALLGPPVSITDIRGKVHDYHGIPLVPTFHPAYLLRNPSAKRLAWQDLKRVKALLEAS
jgi:DNA polymerase